MNTIKNQIPNALTLSNLLCGCLAIKYAFEWDLVMAAYLVGLAAVFDFLDGFAARLLKVSGEMGKQLDSLADMVSFGVVPGIIAFQLMRIAVVVYSVDNADNLSLAQDWKTYIAFLIPLFSAYRLAKFNLDTRQTDKFIGLPTPANAIFFCALTIVVSNFYNPLIEIGKSIYQLGIYNTEIQFKLVAVFKNHGFEPGFALLTHPIFMAIMIALFSFLLISELPLFALKFKNFGWSDNKIRYIFLTISLVMLIIFQLVAIPFIVVLYILISIINNLIFKP